MIQIYIIVWKGDSKIQLSNISSQVSFLDIWHFVNVQFYTKNLILHNLLYLQNKADILAHFFIIGYNIDNDA